VKAMVHARLDAVLSGNDVQKKYAYLTPALRVALQQILRDTVPST
jgi:hypothetical protein